MEENKFAPKGAWLTVNRECNFRCKWCYAQDSEYQGKDEMSLDLAKNLSHIILDSGVKHAILLGGEPTLWAPLLEFNDFAAQEGLGTTLVTNAYMFGVDSFWERYLKHANTQVSVSLKAFSPFQLFKTTGVKNFKTMKKGIERAADLFRSSVGITYNSFYENNLPDMVKFAMDCGYQSVKIDFCSPFFVGKQPTESYIVPLKKAVANIVRDYDKIVDITKGKVVFEINFPLCLWPRSFLNNLAEKNQIQTVCHVVKKQGLIFSTDGKLIMCNALFDYPLGTFGKEFQDAESLGNFMNSKEISDYYKKVSCYPHEGCIKCNLYDKCAGGCPLRWISSGKDMKELVQAQQEGR